MLSNIKNINTCNHEIKTNNNEKKSEKLELFNFSPVACAQTNKTVEPNNEASFELIESKNISNYSNKSRITNSNIKNNSELFNYSDEINTIELQNSQQISDYNQDKSSTTNSSSPFQKKPIIMSGPRRSHLSDILTNSTKLFNKKPLDNRKTSE